tara:strand:+ start:593 stop:1717 length:1125 start_codon:yes stop_codon:yes gene_type:complete
MDMFNFYGQKVAPGNRLITSISIGQDPLGRPLEIPVHILHGKNPGPVLAITAAIHGDELNGMSIIHHLAYGDDHISETKDDRIEPTKLKGTLIMLPMLNPEGVLLGTRETPDGRDMNRIFPGKKDGNQAQRIAHTIFEAIIKYADYLIDIHTAPWTRDNVTHVRADFENSACKDLARAFGTPIVLHSTGVHGTLRKEATDAGCPTILLETGTSNSFKIENVRLGVRGVLNAISHLGMVENKIIEPEYRVLVKKSRWIRSPSGGLLHVLVSGGDLVHKGDILAHITDPFGSKVNDIISTCTGLVVGLATRPLVRSGDPLFHVVVVNKSLDRIEKALSTEDTRNQEYIEELVDDSEGQNLDSVMFTYSSLWENKNE